MKNIIIALTNYSFSFISDLKKLYSPLIFLFRLIKIIFVKKVININYFKYRNLESFLSKIKKSNKRYCNELSIKNYDEILEIYQLHKCFNKNSLKITKESKDFKQSKTSTNLKAYIPDYYNNTARQILFIQNYNISYYGYVKNSTLNFNKHKTKKLIKFPIDRKFGDLEKKFSFLTLMSIIHNLNGVLDNKKYRYFNIYEKMNNSKIRIIEKKFLNFNSKKKF